MPRAAQSDSFVLRRMLRMLALIPRAPRSVTAGQLQAELRFSDETDRRGVERNLLRLEQAYEGDLLCNRASKPYQWSWRRDAAAPSGVPMTRAQALAFVMVHEHLRHALPAAVLTELQPFFAASTSALADEPKHGRWSTKVRVEGLGFRTAPPKVLPAVADAVSRSLLEERRCRIRYRTPSARDIKEYDVNPLGLLVRDGIVSLLCTATKHEDGRAFQLLLHRIVSAVRLEDMRRPKPGFDLRTYDAGGGRALEGGATLRIKMIVDADATMWPEERPLPDQTVELQPNGRRVVEANVPNTREFLAWLRGYGATVEIVEPAVLRARMREEARRLVARYGKA